MKKYLLLVWIFSTLLFGSLQDKSAIVYYGDELSYPMIGVHDYIIVQPQHTNTVTHGFSLYKKSIYAYISIGEVDLNSSVHNDINSSWIVAKNEAWNSDVLDINNKEYQEFIFTHQIDPLLKQGFKNFFFDTLDSYYFYSKTPEKIQESQHSLASFIQEFHKRYPDVKLIINRGFGIIDDVHDAVDAVLFESYYQGLKGKNLAYKEVDEADRIWLDKNLEKVKKYNLDIIAVDYLSDMKYADKLVKKLQAKGFIPYVANKELDIYGKSSKNAVKREILTLIDESRLDRMLQGAHFEGGLIFEYLGYIQKLYDINKGLPDPNKLEHYAGIVIWLEKYYNDRDKLLKWLNEVKKRNIPIVFVNTFAIDAKEDELASLGITIEQTNLPKKSILLQNKMVGFEIEPPMSRNPMLIHVKDAKELLTYQYTDGKTSTPAAITSWGGYLQNEAFITAINSEDMWVTNPFKFFEQALRLPKLPVPDPTTENGKRLLFTHIDGDGIMNKVEGDFGEYSGDVILNKILKKYKIPHSVSVIGAEIDPNGLYPKLSEKMIKITKEMFALENVEAASHTFTHPFFWEKIIDNNLSEEYRLKVTEYQFSLEKELKTFLDTINEKYSPKNKSKKANIIFWSGDCAPRKNALEYIYKNNILAINGGDTTIVKTNPWLTRISPFGLKRSDYYQVYTGAQNENVYTNNWLGPFWGFKRVTQTFELTNSPRRLKPIDIYYHLYSGSKRASLEALKYVFNWALKQDAMPIFTSEYIPKVMDMYEVSMAKDGNSWLIYGMNDLKTIRFEDFDANVDLNNSEGVIGVTQFENHTYLSLDQREKHLIELSNEENNKIYMVSSNGKLTDYNETSSTKSYSFSSYVDLDLSMYISSGCKISAVPKAQKLLKEGDITTLKYKNIKEATITLECE
ncbi:endo alpha-1,4 polygalactosaminidase [Sulfurimonas marina]|uniref:Glycoside-hydrolase family GH114 TIM-barrel domain-containing protein n=1 Tax=Sulfurimonas marina TaxID=2590551 RepID=A0A7M3V9A2_9BACT|nr:endo alpha-1,4 polygalactosaminidase [Sulfurimonas marina]QOP40335.1 hypothetical protein FJR03_00680 [Sulfurimonas marina]